MENTEIWPFSIYFTYPQPTPFLFTSLPSTENYCVHYNCFHACTSKATERRNRKKGRIWIRLTCFDSAGVKACRPRIKFALIRIDSDWFWLIQILLVWSQPKTPGNHPKVDILNSRRLAVCAVQIRWKHVWLLKQLFLRNVMFAANREDGTRGHSDTRLCKA
jgi:hypothetical protein